MSSARCCSRPETEDSPVRDVPCCRSAARRGTAGWAPDHSVRVPDLLWNLVCYTTEKLHKRLIRDFLNERVIFVSDNEDT